MAQSFTQVQGRDYPAGIDAPFRVAETYGPQPFVHNYMDGLRMMWRRTPEATYPDGYLGTIQTRRGDRLLDSVKQRTANRPTTRGIHKGERMDQRDYFWPPEFNLWSGLEAEAEGRRFAPPNLGEFLEYERYPTDRNHQGPRSVSTGNRPMGGRTPSTTDPDRVGVLRSQAPAWSTGRVSMATPYPGR